MNVDQLIVASIASNLKAARLQRGLTVKRLSLITKITQQTIANIESGEAGRVDLVKVYSLAIAMKIPVIDLLGSVELFHSQGDDIVNEEDCPDEIPFQRNRFNVNDLQFEIFSNRDFAQPTMPYISSGEVGIDLKGTTIELWFFPMDSAIQGEQKLMTLFPGFGDEIYLGWEENRVWFGVVPGDEDDWMRLRSGPIPIFQWHHICCVTDGRFATLYLNQVEIGQLSIRKFSSYALLGRIYIGCVGYNGCQDLSDIDRVFNGKIDQPAIWDKPLSPFGLREQRSAIKETLIRKR